MKIAIVLGTRPEIVKLSPIIRECINRHIDFTIIHTNQHYSSNMDSIFFHELKLHPPQYNLHIREKSHGSMTAKQLLSIEKILISDKPDWLIVQGDTNSVLSGALAASKLPIKIAHVEAGLRSFDREMPEEINRIVTDHLSDLLFAPTDKQAFILKNEGIDEQKIKIVGNTIVDAVYENIKYANEVDTVFSNYILLTTHRPSNVDSKTHLQNIIKAAHDISYLYNKKIVFPVHPRTKESISRFSISYDEERLKLINPVGYLEMLSLIKHASLVLTDSGGVQEEACILHTPSLTLRETTERPETIEVGASILVGTDIDKILLGAKEMLLNKKNWKNPFGDGKSAQKIIDEIILHET